MKSSINIKVILDRYTDGDEKFKREIAGLLINNLEELRRALKTALDADNIELYRITSHKVKTTLLMLGDTDFIQIEDNLKSLLKEQPRNDDKIKIETIRFESCCSELIQCLQTEIDS